MSVDMFTSLNNDILQCILYEWLKLSDICQLDIAVCNHSVRQLYYEALQTSTLPLADDDFEDFDERIEEITEVQLYELIKWSKIRGIKNPLQTIRLFQNEYHEEYLTTEYIYELSNDLKSFKYIKSLILSYWNPNLFCAFGSLKYLTSMKLEELMLESNDIRVLGFFLKQLSSIKKISIIDCHIEPILISFLSEIPSLKSLEIKGFDISDGFISELSKLTQLESLSIGCESDKYLDLSFLSTVSQLTKLSITSCKISLQYILSLNQLKELTFVDIIDSNNINYENYLPFHQLELITMDGSYFDYNFLQFIFQSKQLKSFTLVRCLELQSSFFYGIENLSNLKSLTLRDFYVDQQLFINICQLSQLQLLDLSGDEASNKQNICVPFSKLSKQLFLFDFSDQPYIINKNTFEEISQLDNLSMLSFDWDLNNLEDIQPLSQSKRLGLIAIKCFNSHSYYLPEEVQDKIKEIIQLPKVFVKLFMIED